MEQSQDGMRLSWHNLVEPNMNLKRAALARQKIRLELPKDDPTCSWEMGSLSPT